MLRELFNTLTYRNQYTSPDPGMEITTGRWGRRAVHDPRIPAYLEARRRRIVRDGLDPLDRALMDAPTAELLRATAARMAAEQADAAGTRPASARSLARAA